MASSRHRLRCSTLLDEIWRVPTAKLTRGRRAGFILWPFDLAGLLFLFCGAQSAFPRFNFPAPRYFCCQGACRCVLLAMTLAPSQNHNSTRIRDGSHGLPKPILGWEERGHLLCSAPFKGKRRLEKTSAVFGWSSKSRFYVATVLFSQVLLTLLTPWFQESWASNVLSTCPSHEKTEHVNLSAP